MSFWLAGALVFAGACAQGGGDTGTTERDQASLDASAPRTDAGPLPMPLADAGTVMTTPDAGHDAGPPPMPDAGPECACMPGASETESESCGACGEGTRTRTRACEASCTWGAWGSFGGCATTAQCAPGETEAESRSCGACGLGSQMRIRSCDATTCRWGGWGSWGTCSGGGACTPGDTRGCPNGDTCGHEVCRSDCTWSTCQPIVECLRIRPGTTGPPGNNYRCCGTSAWQFCLSSCVWSTSCETCSGCGC